ncbi:MAG TPA: cytochrome c biogenesis protein CcsA [Rubricoccaceae bacterium]|nr:cytochrome c biogenesis protein CcsA [Rubricoccaceae bacterium]
MAPPDRDALPIPRYGAPFTLYRVVTVVWVTAALCFGLLGRISNLPILEHSARNLYFHVPMWFTLLFGWLIAAFHSLRHLQTGRRVHDVKAEQAALVAFAFGVFGIVTGTIWARFTWYVGTDIWWNSDPRQVMVAVQLLICGAYFVLRGALDDERRRGRLAAVYALFATLTLPFLTYVLPRRMESLHPGAEGNPAFSEMDIAPEMRWVFYAAVVGFFLLFGWVYTARVRMRRAELLAEARHSLPRSSGEAALA